MPNWKKVITSGSDAAFRSVVATAGFTGSFTGSITTTLINPSLASNTILISGSTTISNALSITGSVQGLAGFTGSLLGTASIATSIIPNRDTSFQQSVRFIPYLLTAADSPQQLRYTSSLQYNQNLNQVFVTASWAATASNYSNTTLSINSIHPLPIGISAGTFAVSASIPPKPYFYDGTAWFALY